MSKKKVMPWVSWPILIIEFMGFAVAFYLLLISARVISADSMPCPASGIFACTSIIRGKFSYIGPFSIAALGTFYYVVQIALTNFARAGNWWAYFKGLMILGGYGFLGWLRATEIVYLHKICPWCYFVCFLMLCEAIALWPALTPFLPKWKLLMRTFAVFSVFILVSLALCVPAMLFKNVENCYGRQWFPYKYKQLAEDGGVPIEHDIDLIPPGSTRDKSKPTPTPVPIYTPTPAVTPTTTVEGTPTPKAKTGVYKTTDSSRDTEETRALRAHGWKVVADNSSVMSALRHKAPVFLLAFDPICDECSYLITQQLTDKSVEDLPVTKIAIEYSQLRGDLANLMDSMPKMLLIDGEGNILWTHTGRLNPSGIVKGIKGGLNKN
ncbi:MAG: vitamin K epoxide reductase family protein [Candidatus Sumerlaeales bacterium]|nr:vitamin K epoxide reductase family protein [Candidatus Sumerlaeales bacterium]